MKIDGVKITGPVFKAYREILTPDALNFIEKLHNEFESRRQTILENRKVRQKDLDNGILPNFLPETQSIRESDWKAALIPNDLMERKVEITGPVDRKMIINALNSGADVFMADFEDSNSPTWQNNIEGQINLKDAVNRSITYKSPEGKEYALKDKVATLKLRPRGWHLNEEHVLVNGKPVSASLFDFGLYFYHNAHNLIETGSAPYFYLPKQESHLESRLWNDVFNFAQTELSIPEGTVRATQLIETILAAYEMDEMLYELKEHSSGLNAGRWDYLFSIIKKFRNNPNHVFPDRQDLTMDKDFMKAYADLLVKTCHKRNIHAMGGMSALIPIRNNKEANDKALEEVRKDKQREVEQGFDGAWVAHPGLVPIVKEIFDNHIKGQHQISNKRDDVKTPSSPHSLMPFITDMNRSITENGLKTNISVTFQYLAAWLEGNGCVAINNKMEDAATAEISRSQIWQWLEHKAGMTNGKTITLDLVKNLISEELGTMKSNLGERKFNQGKFILAAELLEKLISKREFTEFLTLEAYPHIKTNQEEPKAETQEEFVNKAEAEWKKNPRWEGIVRTYKAEDVYKIKGNISQEYTIAKQGGKDLWNMLMNEKEAVRTLSTMIPQQAIQQVRAGLKAIYISGWQVASGANTYRGMFPDRSIYPVNSVPDLVEHINNVLTQTDQIHHEKGDDSTKWLVPLIADAEAGFGDVLQTFELIKHMIKAGASGIHLEDQEGALKKCGHLGGKVLVPTREFVKKLITARLATDICGTETVLIARTDAGSGSLLKSDIDPYDKSFVDYSKGRTEEGFYHVKAGIDQAISRGLAYAPYSDMLWFETSTPDLKEAEKFAEAIHAKYPGKLLAYNCSPSFNWKAKLSDEQIKNFQKDLEKLGYKFQFVTLSGYHDINHSMLKLAKEYKQEGMLAYSRLQQAEIEAKNPAVKHQEEVGTGYYDVIEQIVSSGQSSTTAMKGSTEEAQFKH